MNKHTACALYLSFLTLPALAQTAEPAAAAPEAAAVLEAAPSTVVVEGRRPGPGVWKVSKDGHVMWVFGTYSPLPQKMEWDASRVERLIAHSQEVLLPPSATGHVGFFRGLTLLPSLIGIKKNPDGAHLKDLVPADAYARWASLKSKYIGDDEGVEAYRPMFAGEELMRAGWKKHGLESGGVVLGAIETIAKKNKVKLSQSGYEFTVDDPRKMVKEFKKSQLDDVACFTKTLDSLEGDIDAMGVRANAWANGNIAEITSLKYEEREAACTRAVMDSAFAKDAAELQQMPARLRESWLKTAEKALAANTSTFAILEMGDILGPKNYLADLQARGYTVESPK
jgi:hypothetical protein